MKTATLDHKSRAPGDRTGELRLDPDSSLVDLDPSHMSECGAMNESACNGCDGPRLTPRRPPGRLNRKVRALAGEIGRLHEQGYTFEAIREALADVGVVVSKSTVHREVARLRPLSKPEATLDAASPDG